MTKWIDKLLAKRDSSLIKERDIICFLNQLAQEMRVFSLSHNHIQKQVIKIHKWLSVNSFYAKNCLLENLEVKPNLNFEEIVTVPADVCMFKSTPCDSHSLEKLIYILGSCSPEFNHHFRQPKKTLVLDSRASLDHFDSKAASAGPADFHKQIYFGQIMYEKKDCNYLLEKLRDLKKRLRVSKLSSENVQKRDFKRMSREFLIILEKIGKVFTKRKKDVIDLKENQISSQGMFIGTSREQLITLKEDNINLLVQVFDNSGVYSIQKEMIVFFRILHHLKYTQEFK